MPMLTVHGLRKSFGDRRAVDGVSFELAPGEILGVLGPNGAGKTTTVSMIAGLMRPDEGEVTIDGRVLRGDTDPAKRRIGLVPQELALYDELSARDNLRFAGGLYGLAGRALDGAIASALTLVGLQDRAGHRVGTFSGGMKRRLNLAAGLLHDPAILLLDEPTVGVDPQSRNAVFENLEALKRQGKALLYTTHYMEEAERLCDRIVIIDQGRVVAHDTVRGLLRLLPAANRLRVELAEPPPEGAWLHELRGLPGVTTATIEGSLLNVGTSVLAATTARVLDLLERQGLTCEHVESERGDLEAVFLALTGRSLRDS
jgi:linearmycin/streptolysin S transport system ATP-binding protein